MRLDVNDESWHPAYTFHVKAFCDGEEIKNVAAASEEFGWVRCLDVDEDGRPKMEPDGVTFKEKHVSGDVEIVFDKPPEQLVREYRRKRRESGMLRARRKWRRWLDLDRLPLSWHAFNKRAANYFRFICAGRQINGR